MSDAEIANAIINAPQAFPEYRKRYGGDPEKGKRRLRQAAHAIMQLWRDLEEEERVGRAYKPQEVKVRQKALA